MFLVNGYNAIKPVLAGVTMGTWPVVFATVDDDDTKIFFAASAALTVLGTRIPMSPQIRAISTLTAGAAAYYSMNFKCVEDNHHYFAPVAGVLTSAVELYQGHRLFALTKIASLAFTHSTVVTTNKMIRACAFPLLVAGLVYPASLIVRATVFAGCKFAELSRRTKLGCVFGTAVLAGAVYCYFKGVPGGPGGDGAAQMQMQGRAQRNRNRGQQVAF